MSTAFFTQLARTIEAAPAQHRRALLAALDGWRLTGPEASEYQFVEAIELALGEEIADRCSTEGE
jgi:hypothetical protein